METPDGAALSCSIFCQMMEHVKNTIAEATKITITVGIAFEYLNLVVNPFGKTLVSREVRNLGAPKK
jgi:uncharacterized membrane protein YccF (DUF307 family)